MPENPIIQIDFEQEKRKSDEQAAKEKAQKDIQKFKRSVEIRKYFTRRIDQTFKIKEEFIGNRRSFPSEYQKKSFFSEGDVELIIEHIIKTEFPDKPQPTAEKKVIVLKQPQDDNA